MSRKDRVYKHVISDRRTDERTDNIMAPSQGGWRETFEPQFPNVTAVLIYKKIAETKKKTNTTTSTMINIRKWL